MMVWDMWQTFDLVCLESSDKWFAFIAVAVYCTGSSKVSGRFMEGGLSRKSCEGMDMMIFLVCQPAEKS